MRHRMGAASGARPLLIAVVLGAVAAQSPTAAPTCDAIEVAGTDSDISTGSFDGLYDQAGACNGQPYYKCTCCTDYDQFLIDKCATPGECDEGWSETRCMSDSPSGGWHHYLWYSSDDEAWQLRMYVGDGADDDGMFAWDECGGSSTFFDEYRLADPDGDLAAAAASTSWELEGDSSWDAHAMTATCAAASVSPPQRSRPRPTDRGAIVSTVRGPELAADDAADRSADFGAERNAHGAPLRSTDIRDVAADGPAHDGALVDPDGPADCGALVNADDGAVGGPHHVAVPDGRAQRTPTSLPTGLPSSVPTTPPSPVPSPVPTSPPSAEPTSSPTGTPTSAPTEVPSPAPTISFPPSPVPTVPPTPEPSPGAITVAVRAPDGSADRGAHDAAFISTDGASHVRTQWSSLGAAFSSADGAADRCPHFDTDVAAEQTAQHAADARAFGIAYRDAVVDADH